MMRILGIDPGYERLGIAVVEKENGIDALIFSECYKTPADLSFPERLHRVGTEVAAIIKKHKPEHLAIENLFFNTNQKTAMHIAEVRGAILYIAMENGLGVFQYTPPQIKAAVAGSGRGSKKDVTAMLGHLIRIDKEIRHDDEYDAIAVAVTHSAIHRI
ncbi:MAG: crossover junction endodeoxyribonuclease RuvC [bacterium]|nr:crossover junction endodeoxyribonuclease RuvC [bacterium]